MRQYIMRLSKEQVQVMLDNEYPVCCATCEQAYKPHEASSLCCELWYDPETQTDFPCSVEELDHGCTMYTPAEPIDLWINLST